ncbi:hypothetical protein E2C01_011414 [Portunus trituberculatus]|uniref:Uncharacterized protein n=1 Tax=Portunus trituberculatus TaxID=210409 RepID=A0A5B7DBM8_PORTR|nr:hypothetical protein [Portunus trituberculatus]
MWESAAASRNGGSSGSSDSTSSSSDGSLFIAATTAAMRPLNCLPDRVFTSFSTLGPRVTTEVQEDLGSSPGRCKAKLEPHNV